MEKIELEQGKIYYLDYNNIQIIGRFKESDASKYYFYDLLYYSNGVEIFKYNKDELYCYRSNIEILRVASKAEKYNLFRFEIEKNTI